MNNDHGYAESYYYDYNLLMLKTITDWFAFAGDEMIHLPIVLNIPDNDVITMEENKIEVGTFTAQGSGR